MNFANFKRSDPSRRTLDGKVFDSIEEMERYVFLSHLQRSGDIRELKWQTKFDLQVSGVHVAYYTADFTYIETATGRAVVEDAKGFSVSKKTGKRLPRVNREFGIKKKLMKAIFGLEVEVV